MSATVSALQMSNKVALVTGSSTGIGLGILKSLSSAGMRTVMHGLDSSSDLRIKADNVEKETGIPVATISADLKESSQIRSMVAEVLKSHGRIDVLVNNAGIQHVAPVVDFPEDKWDDIISILLSATFHASKAVLPCMIEQGFGRIINTGSMHALVASPYKSAYNAAKHGVAGFTKTLALETATQNITVNCICPGYVYTELIENQLDAQSRARGMSKEQIVSDVLLAPQPIKRFVRPSEVGALVRYLCSNEAAPITGACLSIDGGWTAQ